MIAEYLAQAEGMLLAGELDGAIALLQAARQLRLPTVARYELGEALLRASNGHLGWDLYDLHPSRPRDQLLDLPRWQGQRCSQLIVVAEQGFGDAIQFLRFVPRVAAYADRIAVAMHEQLVDLASASPLLRNFEVIGKARARQRSWPSGTYWERLMSLPARLPEARPDAVDAYLAVPTGQRVEVGERGHGTKLVGVAWRSTRRMGFPDRSFPAYLLRQLAKIGEVALVTLHRDQDIRSRIPHAEAVGIKNLSDTAAVIKQCDVVVTADTVTAHLAPALGTPTFVCLRQRPDWRWGTPGSPTQWYRHAQLLFQDERQTWEPVLIEAARRISEAMRGSFRGSP